MTVDSPFEMSLFTRWADLDSNGHMANAAYLDACVDVRLEYFARNGFPLERFRELAIGPVIFRDEIEYFRELRLLDPYRISLRISGVADDGSHFRLVNEYRRSDDVVAARVVSTGSWLDLRARKLVKPPTELAEALRSMPRTADFTTLPSKIRS